MILCIGATPAAQRVMVFRGLRGGEVNRATTTLDGIAGKAVNVAKILKILGADPIAVGFLGGERGESIRKVLNARGIAQEFITVPVPTRECVTVIEEEKRMQTELVEESQPVAAEYYDALLAVVQRRMPKCDAAIMSGTLTPGAPADFYRECVESAQQAGAISILDARGDPLLNALAARPRVVKPNREELATTFGQPLQGESSVLQAMRNLHERGAQNVVVTAGKEPTIAFDGKNFRRIVRPGIRAVNPIGSGDAFTAGLAFRLVRGDDLGEACRWGSAAGAANALTLMAGEADAKEIERLVRLVGIETIPS